MPAEGTLYDVIIVGAGPVGLSLANSLALQDYSVLVLEKNEQIAAHSRAPAIWPRTQEILAQLNVIDTFLSRGLQIPEVQLWDADKGNILMKIPVKDLASITAYPQVLLLPQPETERILLEALKRYARVRVLFSAEAVELLHFNDHVSIAYGSGNANATAKAKIVAGADGAHSFVRDKINASLEGKTYPLKVGLADIVLEEKKDLSYFRVTTKDQLAIAIPIREKTWRIIFPLRKKNTNRPLPEILETAVGRLFREVKYECIWMSEFRIHNRISTSFCKGRVVLAGDAAHLNSPVGGQGMNSGIQDVVPLVEAIMKTLNSNNTTPLMIYSKQRRKKIKTGVNRFTDTLTNLLLGFANGRLIKPIFKVFNYCMRIQWLKTRILKRIAMLS